MFKNYRSIGIAIVFAVCMYYGFKYDSGWAFTGAIISFLCI